MDFRFSGNDGNIACKALMRKGILMNTKACKLGFQYHLNSIV